MNDQISRRTFSEDFKLRLVQLNNSGISRSNISKGYDISLGVLGRRIKRVNATGSSRDPTTALRSKSICSICEKEPTSSDGERYIKTSRADICTVVQVIRSNAHKYSVSSLCKCFGVARSTYHYSPISTDQDLLERNL